MSHNSMSTAANDVIAMPNDVAHATTRSCPQRPPLTRVAATIAYISPVLPTMAETFVTREIRGLRNRGWRIQTVSLHRPVGDTGLDDLRDGLVIAYEGGPTRVLARAVAEAIRHPLRTTATLSQAIKDAVTGRVGGGIRGRCSVLVQAIAALSVAPRLRSRCVAHIHCHFAHSSTTLGMYTASQLGIPFSFTGHANDLFQRRTLLPEKLHRAAFVSCISHWHKDLYLSLKADNESKYHVVRCGIDTHTWLLDHQSHRFVAPSFRIITVCRLVEKKGVDVLIRAMVEFGRVTGQPWELTVVGDGPLRQSLASLASDLDCTDRVRWLGMLDNARVLTLLRDVDVFALPCRADRNGDRDGIPVALMEAMAAGIPVVAGDLPALRELVEHEVTGLLADGTSVPSVSEQIIRLYRSTDLRNVLGTGGRQRVEREFGLDANLDRLEGAFRRSLRIEELNMTRVRPTSASRRYVIVAPCRDEAKFCRKTIDSIIAQSIPPALFIIVDDGSTDETPAILAEYAAKHPFIKVIRRNDRGGRSVGPGVIEAFYHGYDTINSDEFDYVCKLDLDLILPPRYFQTLIERMEANPRLGNCSGKPYYVGPDGQMISEGCGDENAIGASKFYRMECFQQIGGFVRQVMWDGIDGHRCRLLGWVAVSWDDPDIRFTHLRPMGSSHKGILTGRMRHGFGQYFMGTGLTYMTASAVFRMAKRPRIVGGAAMWWGYVRSMIKRVPQYGDREFRRFLRRYQWECLLLGKMAATMRVNQRQASAWNSPSQLPASHPAALTLSLSTPPAAALAESLMTDQRLGISLPAAPDVPPAPTVSRPADPRVLIAGVGIDNLTCQEVIDRIDALVQHGRPSYVVTPNVDHVVRLQRDADMREAYRHASLVLADGMPLLWAARFLGTPLKEKVSGSDLFPIVCDMAARRGYRVFFLGGLPDAAQRASDSLRARHPNLMIRTYCPPIGFDRNPSENAAAIARIRDFSPHILFLGLGAPKQELWMHRWGNECRVPVAIGVGASFDFMSGYVRRAPRIMQKSGLEWTWRLAQEPGRLYRRYLIEDPQFFKLVWKQKRAKEAFDHLWVPTTNGKAETITDASSRHDDRRPVTSPSVQAPVRIPTQH